MGLATPLNPTAIGGTTKKASAPKPISSTATYAAQTISPFGGGSTGGGTTWGTNPPTTPDTYPNQRRGSVPTPTPTPTPSPTPTPGQEPLPAGTPKPDGYSPDGRPYWKNPDNPNQITYQVPGTAPSRVYNPAGLSDPVIEQQQQIEQQFADQQKAMSDWLTGAYGQNTANYTNRMDELQIQSNQFLPAQYGYMGGLIGDEYNNRREALGLQLGDNAAKKEHAQNAWDLLRTDIRNRRGTTNDSWGETKRYLGEQSGLAGEGWQNTVADINKRRGTATDTQNEALRWLKEQGGFADRDLQILAAAIQDQTGTLQAGWNEQKRNTTRLGGEAGKLLDILSGQIGDQRTGAGRDIDLARIIADQQRGTTTERQDLQFEDAARARELADYQRRSLGVSAGSSLSRGQMLQLNRNAAAQDAANQYANLGWTEGMNTIDASQQSAENSYVDRLNTLNTNQRQANLGYNSTMGGLQNQLNTGAIDLEAALNSLSTQQQRGQLGYDQTMGGLQNQINTSNIGYQAALNALDNQYAQSNVGYRGQMAGFQNQLNTGAIDFTAAHNSLNNQYGVGGNNYNYAMAQANLANAGVGNQLSGLNIGEQQAMFGNNMSLWNAQQSLGQQQYGVSQQAATEWNSYMQQMMALGLPAPSGASAPTYYPPEVRNMVAPPMSRYGPS